MELAMNWASVGMLKLGDLSTNIEDLIDAFYKNNSELKLVDKFSHYELVNIILDFWEELEKKGLTSQEIEHLDWGHVEKKYKEWAPLQDLFIYVFKHCEKMLDELKTEENAVTVNDLKRKMKHISRNSVKTGQLPREKYLFMDEFQDSDNAQIDLVAGLAKYLNYRFFAVGDIKQSI